MVINNHNHKLLNMKYADYISHIEINTLWDEGDKHISWTLDPEVNILSGVNGEGKSTILNHIVGGVQRVDDARLHGVIISTSPEDAEFIRLDAIHTPDVRSEYDENLDALQQRYSTYTNAAQRDLLGDVVDRLFEATHKTVDRSSDSLSLIQWGKPLDLHKLSSGEKQLLCILLTVTLQDCLPAVLCMDEPEVSLHIDWQQQLIDIVRQLNPNVQIILTTHSPAMVMNGWVDKVVEVSDIVVSS